MNTLTVGSLFSGVGGFDLGFERAGFKVAWQVEIDPHAQSVLRRHWSDVPLFADVREVGAHNLAPVDVITFGSPCQDLSVAGKRAGLIGERSGLFHEAIRVIRELRPAIAVWENVPGALSSNGGDDFAAVLAAFAQSGALDICWRVLDAQWLGVAQRRRRLFLVADFRGERAKQVLFESESGGGHPAPSRTEREEIAGTLGRVASGSGGHRLDLDTAGAYVPVYAQETADTIGAWQGNHGYAFYPFDPTRNLVAHAITASAGHHGHSSPLGDGSDNQVVAPQPIPILEPGARQGTHYDLRDGLGIGEPGDPMFTLQATKVRGVASVSLRGRDGGGTAELGGNLSTALRASQGGGDKPHVMTGTSVRRLTPRECERLQGFPDDWTGYDDAGCEIADSHRYRMIGNAVCVPVAEWIARRLWAVSL